MTPTTKVYLAGAYERRGELLGYARELEGFGWEVTSRWLRHDEDELNRKLLASKDENFLKTTGGKIAYDNLRDVSKAEVFIAFTGEGESGGRHVEFGYAWGKAHMVVVIGPRENIFHCMNVIRFETWNEFWVELVNSDCKVNSDCNEKGVEE